MINQKRKNFIKSIIKKPGKIKLLKRKNKFVLSTQMQRKINLIRKNLFYINFRHISLNNKSYFNFRRKYKLLFFNKLSRKIIRRMLNYVQFNLIRKMKKLKEKSKNIAILFIFLNIIRFMRKKMILRKLSIYI